MDLSKFKTAIETIAPWLAGTLGTPVMGVAVQALENVFNLQPGTATQANLMNALAGATPQQLQDLRSADQKHAEFMQAIGYRQIEQLAAIDAGDRDSARKMQMAKPSSWPGILSAITTAAVVGVLAARFTGLQLPQDQLTGQMIGSLFTGWGVCLTYWMGNSRHAADAVNMLAQSSPP